MQTKTTYTTDEIRTLLEEVADPEIPVLNIVEMGIVRKIEYDGDKLIVKITPTYSGCPAMHAIEREINNKLFETGIQDFLVKIDFAETWTTDWMTDKAKQKLKDYGIAPPGKTGDEENLLKGLQNTKIIPCPYCDSLDTKLQSEFGSTACKSQYYCKDCQEPFEHFKCI